MPITASNMARNEKTLDVPVADETLTITYYPNLVTSKMIAQLDDALGGIHVGLASLIKTWDLMDDDGNIIPINADNLEALGLPILLKISQAIARDIRPN